MALSTIGGVLARIKERKQRTLWTLGEKPAGTEAGFGSSLPSGVARPLPGWSEPAIVTALRRTQRPNKLALERHQHIGGDDSFFQETG
jgi:hypothetical protein